MSKSSNQFWSKLVTIVLALTVLATAASCGPQTAPPTAEPTDISESPTEPPTEPPAEPAEPTETAPPGESDVRSKTLVVAVDSDPANLEPGTNRAYPIGSEVILNVFDTLVAWKPPEFQELEGRLAEDWTISDDGLTYTFSLRPGVKFHDGTELTAEAVKFSFERTLELNSFMEQFFGPIEEMMVVDPLTLEITLERPLSVFLSWLAQPQAAVVSPAAVEEYGEEFSVNPIGTGPFIFERYTPDTEVVLKANPDYWRGTAKMDQLIFRIIPDAATRRLELEKGNVDIVQQNGQLFSVPVEDIKALKENPDVDVLEYDSQIIRNIDFNNDRSDSPVADKRVREAFNYAIDFDGLVSSLLGGTAVRCYGPVPTTSWGFKPEVEEMAFERDVEKARALLEEAGYGPGDLEFKLYTFQGSLWRDVGTFIQANLAEVGINVEVAQTEFPQFRELHVSGEHHIALSGFQPWYNDPDAHVAKGYLSDLAGTSMNFRMPANEELDQMIRDAQSAISQEERKELYYEIQEELMDFVPGVYLFTPKIIIYKRVDVEGLVVNSAPPLNEYWSVSKTSD